MRCGLALLASSLAFAQAPSVFHLTQQRSPQDIQEAATAVRSLLDIDQLTADDVAGTITVGTSQGKAAAVGWLLQRLDQPGDGAPMDGQEFYSPEPGPEMLRIFYARNAATPAALQEIAVSLRAVATIRRVFVYNRLKAVLIRDTVEKARLAAWLFDQLDRPGNTPTPGTHEYKVSDTDQARVFELSHAPNPAAVQEMTTLIRSTADIVWLIPDLRRNAVAVRGKPEQVELAAWLVKELDRPSVSPAGDPAAHEFRMPQNFSPRDGETVVRVFYLPPGSPEQLYETAQLVRANTHMKRSFVYSTVNALSVRGTDGQIATAEKTLQEMAKSRAGSN